MEVQDQINRLTQNVADTYSVLAAKGAVMPAEQTSDYLAATAASIQEGSVLAFPGAGAHNAIYRGNYLGSSVTDEQYAAIAAGTFENLYIGDYWSINGVNYRIAAFDYYYNKGDAAKLVHHVTLVPDNNMYTGKMNDANTTDGAYVGSKMYTEGLNQAKETIYAAFGIGHILNHRTYLHNAITNNYASGGSWYDSAVELMTEQNAFGCRIYSNCRSGTSVADSYTLDNSQYPLFAHRPDMISNRNSYWLRDVLSSVGFCRVWGVGTCAYDGAASVNGVRPAFSIIG